MAMLVFDSAEMHVEGMHGNNFWWMEIEEVG